MKYIVLYLLYGAAGLIFCLWLGIHDFKFRRACEAKGGTAISTDKYSITCIEGKEIHP